MTLIQIIRNSLPDLDGAPISRHIGLNTAVGQTENSSGGRSSARGMIRFFGRFTTWQFWRKLLLCLCMASVVGHLLEWVYCAIGCVCFGSVDPTAEVLTNPLKPFFVYGIGIDLCFILLVPFRDVLFKLTRDWRITLAVFFIISVILGMDGELIQGFTQNQPDEFGNYPLWDVSDYPGNIAGQAWIVNDLMLGAIITLATWVLCPLVDYWLGKLSEQTANRLTIVVVIATVLLTLVTYGFI